MSKRDDNLEVIRLLIVVLLLIFAYSVQPVHGQTEAPTLKKCDHTSESKTRFDMMRILPPSKIFWDGVTLTATFAEGIEQLKTDKQSVLHIPENPKGKLFWIVYDSCDNYVYVVDEVLKSQFKKE